MTAVKPRLVNLPAGLRADQPAAASVAVGALYFVTDEGVVERNNGTTWDTYSGVPEDISLNSLTFVGTSVPATPAVGSAVIFGASAGGHTAPSWMDEQGFVVRLTRDLLLLVRNTSGSTITRGQACRFTGSTGVTPTIGLADADVFDSGRPRAAVGLAIETMANNAYGAIILSGLISDLNTSGFVEGATVFLSTTAGSLSSTAPSSAGCFVQPCGQVTRTHAVEGSIELDFEVPATTLLANLTAGRIPFVEAGPILGDDPLLVWDDTNKRMGIGTNTPTQARLAVGGNAQFGVDLPGQFQTTIIAPGITAADTTIPVVDASGFPTAGILKNNLELIRYTGTTASSFTGCTRGRFNSTAEARIAGSLVALMPFVVAENDTTLTSILLGPGNAYIGCSGLAAISQATTPAIFKVGSQFSVSGTGGIVWQDAGATGAAYLFFDGTNAVVGARTAHPIQFRTNHTARAFLTANSNVVLDGATNSEPGAGTKALILGDGTVPSSLVSNTAALYANDVSGTVELFGINEAGTSQQLTGDVIAMRNAVNTFTAVQHGTAQPSAFVTKSGAQTLTHNTPAAVTFDGENYDVGSAHDNSTNNHRLTVPTGGAGTYMIVGNVSYVANSAGLRAAALIKNGATVLASVVINAVVGDGTAMQAVAVAQLAAADYVHLSVLQTSGGNLDASAAGTFLQWVKVW